MSKKTVKYLLNVLLLVVIIAGALLILLRDQSLSDIFEVISEAGKGWLLAGAAFVFVHVCSESVILNILFRTFDSPVALFKCIFLSCTGFFYSAITPSASGGQPVQVYYMTKFGVDVLIGTLCSMLVTICYKLALLSLLVVFLFTKGGTVLSAISQVPLFFLYGLVGNTLFMGFLCVAVFKPSFAYSIISGLIKFGGRIKLLKHPEKTLAKAIGSLRQYEHCAAYVKKHLSLIPRILAITFVQRLAYFSVCYMVYRSFGLSGTDIFEFFALQVVLALAVDALPLPGAAGANEGVFTLLFKRIFGETVVFSGLLLYRGLTYFFLMFATGIITLLGHILIMRRKESVGC
ncbi:MAG: flippase-like domain-containing protein [Lachnospiraceae bacterium]|nr:flippase-like domain-containing protein [Lachnospiraceae bacterium]